MRSIHARTGDGDVGDASRPPIYSSPEVHLVEYCTETFQPKVTPWSRHHYFAEAAHVSENYEYIFAVCDETSVVGGCLKHSEGGEYRR